MKKYAIFEKTERDCYKFIEDSDESMFTLFMLLGDGLSLDCYINFLMDDSRIEFFGNVTSILKNGSRVTVSLDEEIIPDSHQFITTRENLILILQDYCRLERLGVNRIEIKLEDDVLTIIGQ